MTLSKVVFPRCNLLIENLLGSDAMRMYMFLGDNVYIYTLLTQVLPVVTSDLQGPYRHMRAKPTFLMRAVRLLGVDYYGE